MTELWNDLLNLNWVVLAVVLAILFFVATLILFGLITLGMYLITRVPPFRWVFTTLLDAATLPARRWAETTIDIKLAPLQQLVEWDALGKFAEMLSDQARMAADLSRTEGKAERAAELALKVEAATQRLQADVDDLTTRLDAQITYRAADQE